MNLQEHQAYLRGYAKGYQEAVMNNQQQQPPPAPPPPKDTEVGVAYPDPQPKPE